MNGFVKFDFPPSFFQPKNTEKIDFLCRIAEIYNIFFTPHLLA